MSVRTTEVVRPVMLHLHASRDRFRAPIIIHADVFESKNSKEKPVDAAVFIDSARKLLPEAIISLGWTRTNDYLMVNKLDWRQTFRLVELVYNLEQPLILNMKLNDVSLLYGWYRQKSNLLYVRFDCVFYKYFFTKLYYSYCECRESCIRAFGAMNFVSFFEDRLYCREGQ